MSAAYAEDALLLAVRNRLRLPIAQGGAGYSEAECEVEYDEQAGAVAGQVYVAVMPAGWRAGPVHDKSGGVDDLLFGVSVMVVKRIGNVPRDRRREVFFANVESLNAELDKVFKTVDWSYDTINTANSLIAAKTGSTEGFVMPLRVVNVDKPQICGGEMFAAANDTTAGMKRVINFHGARRITHK